MPIVDKVIALLGVLSPQDIQAMPPAQRQRFVNLCRRLAEVAETPAKAVPKSGVLYDLHISGGRSQ